MSTYVIIGVSKGIGFEFVRQLSADPKNTVIGLVRDTATTEQKVAAELGVRKNIHVLRGDLDDYATLKKAAAETASIVGEEGVDYLVANAAYLPNFDAFDPIGALGDRPEEIGKVTAQLIQTNVVGTIHLFNVFVPLVLRGKAKKVIAITSGMADIDLINSCEIDMAPLYSASKAALNVIVAKFSAQYKKDGVLFLSISPGVVDTGNFDEMSPEQAQVMGGFVGRLIANHAPDFKGPITPEQSVQQVRSVWEKASIESGSGGAFVSHLGNKQWV